MRRYSRFDDLYENAGVDSSAQSIAAQLEDAKNEFLAECCDILDSYELSDVDLDEVAKYTDIVDILDETISKGSAFTDKYSFDTPGWRRKKYHRGKKMSKTGGKFWGEGDTLYAGEDARKPYSESDWYKNMRGVKPKRQNQRLKKMVGTDGRISDSWDV